MKMLNMIKMVMLTALVFGLNTGIASAALIGGFGVTGSYTSDATTVTLTGATGTSGTDSFSTVSFGTSGTVTNGTINFSSFAPVSNVLEIGGWQLDLTSLVVDAASTPDKLKLSGSAWLTDISSAMMGETAATWTFSAQNASSYSLSVSAVPVPAAVWLFGSGLLGLVGVARRRKA